MESQIGRVVAVTPPSAVVDVDAATVCLRCASGKGCGAGLLAGDQGTRRIEVPLPAAFNVAPGDRVVLALDSHRLLRAAGLAYGLPLAAMLITLSIANAIAGSLAEGTAIGLAAAGLAGGIVISRWRLKYRCAGEYLPRIQALQTHESPSGE